MAATDGSIDFVFWLQSESPPWLVDGLRIFNWMGGLWFYLLSLPLVFWCMDKALGRKLTVVILVAAWTNGWLKTVLDQPRPFEVSSLIKAVVLAPGGGMPSAHAMLSLLFWGLIAFSIRKAWVFVATGALLLLIGLSRVVHGVHFAEDVLVGWMLGAVILFGTLRWTSHLSISLAARPFRQCLAVVLAAVPILYAIWPLSTAVTPRSPTALGVTVLGLLLGVGLGFVVENRFLAFAIPSGKRRGAVRYLVGIGLFVAVAMVLKELSNQVANQLPVQSNLLQQLLRLTRYGLLGAGLSAGLPWLFLKFNWLHRHTPQGSC